MKKTIGIAVFTCLICFALLVFCPACQKGEGNEAKNTEAASGDVSSPDFEGTEAAGLAADLPDLDFSGKSFVILGMDTSGRGYDEYTPGEQIGEVINDAFYARNLAVEERLNVKVNAFPVAEGKLNDKLKASVLSGTDDYHVYLNHAIDSTAAVLNGYLSDLNRLPYVDMSRPWWNQTAKETLTLNGRMYLTMNDIAAYSSISYVHTMFYNKNLAQKYGLPDIYEIIKGGSWTLSKLNELIRDTGLDLNGDGVMDGSDQYGFVGSHATAGVFLTGFDQPIMKVGEGGYPELAINTEKTVSIAEKVYALCFENKDSYVLPQPKEGVITEIFKQGRALFYNGFICDANAFRDMDEDYGIVPMPKYDEAQTGYYTTIRGDNLLFGLPSTVSAPEFEFVGAVSEALSFESYRAVRPAVYDITLKLKGTRDDASIEILDMVTSGIKLDFGFIYHGWKGFGFVLWDMFDAKNKDFASYYEKKEAAVTKYYAGVIDIFKNLE